MNKTKIKRKKRLELMNLQSHIEKVHCVGCESNYSNADCDECPFFKKLNEIGNELLQISTAERTYKPMEDEDAKREYKSLKNIISIEIYHHHKNNGLNDIQICETLDIKLSSFRKWKKREGLLNEK